MPFALLIAALSMQPGPVVGDGAGPSLGLPMVDRPAKAGNRRHAASPPPPIEEAGTPAAQCMDTAQSDPAAAEMQATAMLTTAKGAEKAAAHRCLGAAYAARGEWGRAEQAFLAGREAASDNVLTRARLGAMAGNAALIQGGEGATRALSALDRAEGDAISAKDNALAGSIETDRARALVTLGQPQDAAKALAAARANAPDDGTVWLLSATLSRRMEQLAQAQTQIEQAAKLSPLDPEVGLEAGVIAMLAGREDAARKSWQSAINAAPQSDAGKQAAAYLAQVGPPANPQGSMPNPANTPSTAKAPNANAR